VGDPLNRLASHNAADAKAMRSALLAALPVGREWAKPADVLAEELGTSTRMIGALVADIIAIDRVPVGSLCGQRPGYFICRDVADVEAGAGHSVRRARSTFVRIAEFRRAAASLLRPDQLRFFDVEGAADLAIDASSAGPVEEAPAASSTAGVPEGSGAEEEATELSASFGTESPDPTGTISSGAEAGGTHTMGEASAPGLTAEALDAAIFRPDLENVLASGGWAEWADE
jgi:hypothetical protein